GPAAAMRAAQYPLAGQAGGEALTLLPAGQQTVIDPLAQDWPRVLMAVSEVPEDLRAPLLLTFVQEAPREPYRLWSWQRLFGGGQMPATMQPQIGSEVVPGDQAGTAALSAQDVMAQYLDLVTNADASAFSGTFTDDPVRTRIAQQRDAWTAAVGQGSVTETYTPVDGGPWAMAAADGGSVVTGAFQTVTTLTLVDSTLTVNDATSALLGTTTITQTLTMTWLCTIAFAVPPAGSAEPVTVLGAEYVLTAATGQ
ncbi:MAG TPA: hypothetical protein PKB06_03655, partial [Actinotalea sp.]|nr:hypothetical protein [Actinotalea sp.]